jgi:HPt (histidine-containing phosphotransfer) domain-containing protein
VALAAHTLRGSAYYFDASDVVAAAGEAEQLAKAGDVDGLRALLPQLEAAVADFRRSLRAGGTPADEPD